MKLPLSAALFLASSLPGQLTAGFAQMPDPYTGLPSNVFYRFSSPNVFWATFPDNSIGVVFQGNLTFEWFIRMAGGSMDSIHGAGNWSATRINVLEAGYLLAPGVAPTGHIRVDNFYDCGHWHHAPATRLPSLPGWHIGQNGVGTLGPTCSSSSFTVSDGVFKVYPHEWNYQGPPMRVEWSYVRFWL